MKNLAKDKFGNESSEKMKHSENEVELANISSDEDNEFVPIEKKRLIVLNHSGMTVTPNKIYFRFLKYYSFFFFSLTYVK